METALDHVRLQTPGSRLGAAAFFILLASAGMAQVDAYYPADPWATIDASDLESPYEPGSDYAQIILPIVADSYYLDCDVKNNTTTYIIQVRLQNFTPPSYITSIEIRRTDDGTGTGWINGGTDWLTLTDAWQELFTYRRVRNGVHLELRITMTVNGIEDGADIQIARIRFRRRT